MTRPLAPQQFTIAALLLLSILATSAHAVATNPVINNTGINVGTDKITKTEDWVICRGGSGDDDTYKTFTCDAVCKSTDSDCAPYFNASFADNRSVRVMRGYYPFLTNITKTGTLNLKITSNPGVVWDFSGTTIQFVSTNNTELGGVVFNGTTDGGAGFVRFANAQGIYVHETSVLTPGGNSRVMYISNGTRVTLKNNYWKLNSTGLCMIDASGRDWVVDGNYFENDQTACLSAFGSLCSARFTNNHYVGAYDQNGVSPYASISLEEFANWCDPANNVSYDHIYIGGNTFDNTVGVLQVSRNLSYLQRDIRMVANSFRGAQTAISLRDRTDNYYIGQNTIDYNGTYHAVSVQPQYYADDNFSRGTIIGNIINSSVSGISGDIVIDNAVNVTAEDNTIRGNGDCIYLVQNVTSASMTGNILSCQSKGFRISSSSDLRVTNNIVRAPTPVSAAFNSNFIFDNFNYNALPTCAVGGLADGATIIYNNSGSYETRTCYNGAWISGGTPYQSNASGWVNTSSQISLANTSTLVNLSNMLVDNANSRISIGGAAYSQALSVGYTTNFSAGVTYFDRTNNDVVLQLSRNGVGISQIRTSGTSSSDGGIGFSRGNTATYQLFVNISSTGGVGIKTSAPTRDLDVNGTMNISGMAYHYGNITMKAPNGSLYNCGVSNAGSFTCS